MAFIPCNREHAKCIALGPEMNFNVQPFLKGYYAAALNLDKLHRVVEGSPWLLILRRYAPPHVRQGIHRPDGRGFRCNLQGRVQRMLSPLFQGKDISLR